jgi:hypothetical protein
MVKTNQPLSFAAIASACGASLIEAKSFEAQRQACLDNVNKGVMTLHKGKVTVGHNKKCPIASAFYDALVSGGLGKGTAANYLGTFRKAVEDGKPVTEWNPSQSKAAKAKAKAKGEAKGKKEFADKLASAFRDADFESFINDLEASFQADDISTLFEGVKSFLEASGIELK